MSRLTRRTMLAGSAVLLGGASEGPPGGSPPPPEPLEGDEGARDLGPRNILRDTQNPD